MEVGIGSNRVSTFGSSQPLGIGTSFPRTASSLAAPPAYLEPVVAPKVFLEPVVLASATSDSDLRTQKMAAFPIQVVAPPRLATASFAPLYAQALPTMPSNPGLVVNQRASFEVSARESSVLPTMVSTPPPWPPQMPGSENVASFLPPFKYKFYGPQDGVDDVAPIRDHSCKQLDPRLAEPPEAHHEFSHVPKEYSLASECFADETGFGTMAEANGANVQMPDCASYTSHNLEAQIQELLEGQRCIMEELNQVKAQVSSNHNELEVLRQCSQPMPAFDAGGQDYYQPPQTPLQDFYQPHQFKPIESQHNQYQDGYLFRPDGFENRQVRFQQDEPQQHIDPRLGSSMALTNLGYDDNMGNVSMAMQSMSAQMSSGARTLHTQLKQRSFGSKAMGGLTSVVGKSKVCC